MFLEARKEDINLDIRERLKRWFKLRFAVIYPFGVLVMFFYSPTEDYFKLGLPFIIIGLLIRVWANGYAIKMEKLTTSGPYAYVRNPLYLGTMLIIVGFAVLLRTSFVGVVFVAIMGAVYYRTIKKEETCLEGIFKRQYSDYKKNVPAMWLRITPYRGGEKWAFSFRRLFRSKEYKLFFWILILVMVFYLKEELIIEDGVMDAKMWGFVIAAFFLGLTDLITEILNRRRKH